MDVNITYETLFDTLRKEKSSDELQDLEDNFYDDVNAYLLDKKSTYKQNKDPKTKQQIQNSKKLVKEIFERRQKKILLLAFNQGRTNVQLSTNHLLKEEAYFYQTILQTINKYTELLTKSTTTKGKTLPKQEFKTEEVKTDETKVEFLTNLPKFLGKDLESYGPYQKGDVVTIPNQLAEILVDKQRAKRI